MMVYVSYDIARIKGLFEVKQQWLKLVAMMNMRANETAG